MNSKDTVLAVMKDVQGLREHDRKTGQDARWQGLDKVPDAALHSLKMHGGRLTHEVLHSEFSNATTTSGVLVDRGTGSIRFKIFGNDMGEPVTDEVWAAATNKGGNASAKLYKRALRTFLVDLLQLPDDRAEPSFEVSEAKYLVKISRRPKSIPKYFSEVNDIPWTQRTEMLGARIVGLTLDEYAAEWARYFIEAQSTLQIPVYRPFLSRMLQSEGFSCDQADHGVTQALIALKIEGTGVVETKQAQRHVNAVMGLHPTPDYWSL
tara:strand:+ start:301 stop:1095 length:795 start_codon:yes stop_codon:yes gene_type:complete